MPLQAKTVLQSARDFFTGELWPGSKPGQRAGLRDWARFGTVVVHGFNENRCLIRAAALTYNTLLALVPLLAVVLGVSKAILATQKDKLFDICMKAIQNVAPQLGQLSEDQQKMLRDALDQALGAVSAGKLGMFGSFMLVVTCVSLFSTVERALNDIWGVARGRSAAMKIVFYWAALTLGSVLVFFAIGMTSTLNLPAVVDFLNNHGVLKVFGNLVPYMVLWIGFFLLYKLMPNTQVDTRAALLGGIVVGTLWQLNNSFNVIYVSKVLSANKLYGSLGLVPVFMLGVYIAWIFVLLGAQIAYTLQNAQVLAREKGDELDEPNQNSKERIALRVMLIVARQFLNAEPPLSTTEISTRIGARLHLVNQIVQRLANARLVVELAGNTAAFEPARPVEKITALDVLWAMRELDGKPHETNKDDDDRVIRATVHKLGESFEGPARSYDFRRLVAECESPKG